MWTFQARRIIENTMNAIQQAEELESDLSREEYIRMMAFIARELQIRADEAVTLLLAEV